MSKLGPEPRFPGYNYNVIFTAFCYSKICKRTLERKRGEDKQKPHPHMPKNPQHWEGWLLRKQVPEHMQDQSHSGQWFHCLGRRAMIYVHSAEYPCPSFPFFLSLGPRIKLCLEGKFPSSTKWLGSSQQNGQTVQGLKGGKGHFLPIHFVKKLGLLTVLMSQESLARLARKLQCTIQSSLYYL